MKLAEIVQIALMKLMTMKFRRKLKLSLEILLTTLIMESAIAMANLMTTKLHRKILNTTKTVPEKKQTLLNLRQLLLKLLENKILITPMFLLLIILVKVIIKFQQLMPHHSVRNRS